MSTPVDDTTSTTHGAKAHARSHDAAFNEAMPVFPPTDWPRIPADVPKELLTHAEAIPGGRYTTVTLARGTRLRMRDVTGNTCASLMMWRADAPHERLNTADTVKIPWQAYVGVGHPLLSDQGRILASIEADSGGHHDVLAGVSTAESNREKFGAGAPESATPAAYEMLLLSALKLGLSERDLPHPLSFFHGIRVESDGRFESTGTADAGAYVDIVTHLPVHVAIAISNHPLDPAEEFTVGAVDLLAWKAENDLDAINGDDSREPEFRRAVANTLGLVASAGLG